MFQANVPSIVSPLSGLAGAAATLSSALAYAIELTDARITVVDDCGVIVLEGEAPRSCLSQISDIAASVVGSRYCSLIRPI